MAAATSSSSSCTSMKGPDPCPICLESDKKEEAYLDRCFHSFCYKCIAHWSNVITERHSQSLSSIKCPLCKTENFSIVHGVNGEFFQRHYINQDNGESYLSSAHKFRLQCYNSRTGMANNVFDVQQYWKRCKYLQKNIWLQSWLRREIQALTQEDDVDIIVHHIQGVLQSFLGRQERKGVKVKPEQKREEFKDLLSDAARPFVLGRTERFVDEVELFLASGFNIEAYDKVCMQFAHKSTSVLTTREYEEELHGCHLCFLGEDTDRSD